MPHDSSPPTIEQASSHRLKLLLRIALESAMVVGFVIVFFLLLLAALNNFFPIGAEMRNLMQIQQSGDLDSHAQNELWLRPSTGQGAGGVTAMLSLTQGDVKSKRVDKLIWSTAKQNMVLYGGDAIHTFSQSRASITFDEKNKLELGSDTLVIINSLDEDFIFLDRQSTLILVAGELSGMIESSRSKSSKLIVSMLNAEANIHPTDGNAGKPVEFKISIDESSSASTITILQGNADITAQGITQTVNANQSVTVKNGEVPSVPEVLPEKISLDSPANDASFYYREIPSVVDLTWKEIDAKQYRIEISQDPTFSDTLLDEITDIPSYKHNNLWAGRYYWRVSGINSSGSLGAYGESWQLNIIHDDEPPMLEVQFPTKAVSRNSFVIKGHSEPQATIYVAGTSVAMDSNGNFVHTLMLNPGVNVVLVEALDAAGNSNFLSELLHVTKQGMMIAQ